MNLNLLKLERFIGIYKKKTEILIGEINIDSVPYSFLIEIITPKADDPMLYDGYILTQSQLGEINRKMNKKIRVNFKENYYVLECAGIYE